MIGSSPSPPGITTVSYTHLEQALKALPCSGVVQSGCDVQIVYGIRAPEVRQAVERRLNRVVC